jgi:DNA-binding response OmpR family regulator
MKPSLVIIDDNEMMREFLSVYFQANFQVESFGEASRALEKFSQTTFPDIILLDLNMPGFSGYDFLEVVQTQFAAASPCIFVLSSKDKSEDRIRCLDLGATDYLVKPFHPQELALRVKRSLKKTA